MPVLDSVSFDAAHDVTPLVSPRPSVDDRVVAWVDRLATQPIGGYHPDGEAASEPTAWSALALHNAGQADAAGRATDWLADRQGADGSVGVTASQDQPGWPTALAILAWRAVDADRYAEPIENATEWAFAQRPWTVERDRVFGHDTMLEGWSWAPATHSWLEPTAFFAVALRHAGHADHRRCRQAGQLLDDRLLPGGGANYGNTTVFGQTLLQHAHSSGVVAWALAAEGLPADRLAPTCEYLRQTLDRPTGVASLAWTIRGLAALGVATSDAAERLAQGLAVAMMPPGTHPYALAALAAQESHAVATVRPARRDQPLAGVDR